MEVVKEFLESSTIHGLTYISTTKAPISKIFWVGVVIAGFTTAGILIQNSFKSWGENPVATTIETLPIAKIKFPLIDVCPPENSFTYMNYDLQKADNIIITKEKREDLIKMADKMLYDEEVTYLIKEQKLRLL